MKFNETLQFYKALSDETRLRLIHIFQYGYFHVNELLEILDMGQSRVSRHLKILYNAGVLTIHREGVHNFYGLKQDAFPLVKRTLQIMFEHNERLTPDELAVRQHLEERKRANTEFFNTVAEKWDIIKNEYADSDFYLDEFRSLIDTSDLVVELGSGTGSLLVSLAEKKGRYLGVDMSSEMVKIASSKAENMEEDIQIEFKVGEIENLPLEENSAATVIISMVLHHLLLPEVAFQEAARILKPGGVFIVHDLDKHDNNTYREIYNHRWLGFERSDLQLWFEDNGFGACQFVDISPAPGQKMFLAYAQKREVKEMASQ